MRYTILLLLLAVLSYAPASLAAGDGVLAARSTATDQASALVDGDLLQSGDPDSFVLSAAYPNPFNPRTSFSLSVEERQQVTVQIFNLLGVQVKELFSGVMDAGESRTFTFTADDLPSGIYLYRVQGESFTATRQMTLLK